MTTFEIFLEFASKYLQFTQETLAEHLNISLEALKKWKKAKKIPSRTFIDTIKSIRGIFETPNEELKSIYVSSKNIIEFFVKYVEDNGYIVDNRKEAIDEFSLFLVKFFQDEKVYSMKPTSPLHSRTTQCSELFYGRDKLIEEIHKTFQDGNNVVFLVGMGGIGKSELARQYAKIFNNEYNTIVFARYEKEKGLSAIIADDMVFAVDDICRFENPYEKDYDYAYRKITRIKSTCDKRTLIIIDNYDVETADTLLQYFTSNCDYHILFTTRYDQEKKYKQIFINEIQDDESLKDLVISYCDPAYMILNRDDPYFQELFHLTCRHTLTLELVSLYMAENSYSLKDMINILENAGFEALSNHSFTHNDNNKTAFEFIKEIFKLSFLSEDEKSLLRHMALTPDSGISNDIFKEWNGSLFNNCRTKLIKKRLIKFDSDTELLTLHPIIREVVMAELTPTYDNCKEFLDAYVTDIDDLKYSNFSLKKKKVCAECGIKICSVLNLSQKTFILYYEIGKTLFSINNMPYILTYRLDLYDFAVKNFGEKSMEACMIAIQVGHAYRAFGNYEKALYWQKDIALGIILSEKESHPLYWDLSERCYDQLGYIYLERNKNNEDFNKSEEHFYLGYQAAENLYDTRHLSKALIIYKHATPLLGLCNLYFACQNADLLKTNIHKLNQIFDELRNLGYFMDFDTSYVSMLWCKYNYLIGAYKEAIVEFEKTIKLRKNNYSYMSTTIIELHVYAADCCSKIRDTQKQIEILYNAIDIANKLCIPNHGILDKLNSMLFEATKNQINLSKGTLQKFKTNTT